VIYSWNKKIHVLYFLWWPGGYEDYFTTTIIFTITHSLPQPAFLPIQNTRGLLLLMGCLLACLIPTVPLRAWVGLRPFQLLGAGGGGWVECPLRVHLLSQCGPELSHYTDWASVQVPYKKQLNYVLINLADCEKLHQGQKLILLSILIVIVPKKKLPLGIFSTNVSILFFHLILWVTKKMKMW
jgi:hypothetical protein